MNKLVKEMLKHLSLTKQILEITSYNDITRTVVLKESTVESKVALKILSMASEYDYTMNQKRNHH